MYSQSETLLTAYSSEQVLFDYLSKVMCASGYAYNKQGSSPALVQSIAAGLNHKPGEILNLQQFTAPSL